MYKFQANHNKQRQKMELAKLKKNIYLNKFELKEYTAVCRQSLELAELVAGFLGMNTNTINSAIYPLARAIAQYIDDNQGTITLKEFIQMFATFVAYDSIILDEQLEALENLGGCYAEWARRSKLYQKRIIQIALGQITRETAKKIKNVKFISSNENKPVAKALIKKDISNLSNNIRSCLIKWGLMA